MIILGAALFAVGHMIRDGWPSFHDMTGGKLGTHAARVSGAFLCGLGALAGLDPTFALVVFLGILTGFYFDMRHGEAAGVDTPVAVLDSFLSGITSLVPLALALAWFRHSPWYGAIVAVGLVKPAIWKLAWLSNCQRLGWWWEPTRIAAMVFGALIGLAVGLIA